jgi:hypothetical protein
MIVVRMTFIYIVKVVENSGAAVLPSLRRKNEVKSWMWSE